MNNPEYNNYFVYQKPKRIRSIIGKVMVILVVLIFLKELAQNDTWGIFGAVCFAAFLGPIGMVLISLDAKKRRDIDQDFSTWVRRSYGLHTGNYGTKYLGKLNYKAVGMGEKVPVEVSSVEKDTVDDKTGKPVTTCYVSVTRIEG